LLYTGLVGETGAMSGADLFENGGATSRENFMKKEIEKQRQIEKNETFKKYRVNVYIQENGKGAFPFVDPLMTDNLFEAMNYPKNVFNEQRKYRNGNYELWATIDEFQPIESRSNVIYPYKEIHRFGEEDVKSSKYEKGGKLATDEIKKRYELLDDLYNNEDTEVEYEQILKVGDVIYGDGIVGYLRIKEIINDHKKGDYFVMQDRYDNRFGFYIVQSVRELFSKQIFIKNVDVKEKDFLHSEELISLYKKIQYLKRKISTYENNPNDASNYHGITYQSYMSAKSELPELMDEFRKDSRNEKVNFESGGQLEMKFARGGKVETKIQKKVDEINAMIEKAFDSNGEPLWVVDTSSTWQEPVVYKPIIYRNGRLYIEYFEPYSGKTVKETILKINMEEDGYGTLLEIAKMYRGALKNKSNEFKKGGRVSFKEKSTAIAKKFVGKKVETKYQKEFGKTYDKEEAKLVGNRIAGSQKAKYDAKMASGGKTDNRGNVMQIAKQIRKDGESWQSALKRANEQIRSKK